MSTSREVTWRHSSSARSNNRIHENKIQEGEQSPKQPVLLEHNKTGAQLQMSCALEGTEIRTEKMRGREGGEDRGRGRG